MASTGLLFRSSTSLAIPQQWNICSLAHRINSSSHHESAVQLVMSKLVHIGWLDPGRGLGFDRHYCHLNAPVPDQIHLPLCPIPTYSALPAQPLCHFSWSRRHPWDSKVRLIEYDKWMGWKEEGEQRATSTCTGKEENEFWKVWGKRKQN